MATIYDVAAEARVSPKTVSRVMNGDAPVRRETREAVEAAILKLGYVPSTAARTMRSNRSGLVGLITGAISVAPPETQLEGLPELYIVQGIQSRMELGGKTLLISDTGGCSQRVAPLVRTFMEHRVEGLIYVADHHRKVDLPPMPRTVKLVLVNCFDDRDTPAILPDDTEGQRQLTAELIRRGHRHIAYLSLSEPHVATGLRVEGYRRALQEAGIDFDPALVAPGDDQTGAMPPDTMWDVVQHMLARVPAPTVICCGNDRMAMRLYGLLRAEGVSVPGDMSVAGYDDYRLIAESLLPSLTTVELPYPAMGRAGAERLLSMIDDPETKPGTPQYVRGEVVWRNSVVDLTKRSSKAS